MSNTCKIEGCNAPVKYKGMCGKHYKRAWRHGNPNCRKIGYARRHGICSEEGCNTYAVGPHGLCHRHHLRLQRYGRLTRERGKHNESGPWITTNGYRLVNLGGCKREFEHRLVAESAIRKELPPHAVVHHINGDTLDNRKENLLICTQAYHLYLHRQMRKKGWQK